MSSQDDDFGAFSAQEHTAAAPAKEGSPKIEDEDDGFGDFDVQPVDSAKEAAAPMIS